MDDNEKLPSLDSDSAGQSPEEKGSGCFYTINTLMILFGLIPMVIGVILFLLWLVFR